MNRQEKKISKNIVAEPSATYGFTNLSEDDKLRRDMLRSDKEKFLLFTQMLRRNKLLNKASVISTQNK
ncbi:MAG: hypothetical protein JST07_10305 [Bacteroidetes bacterium]|nr:hypothetical protein [Bacteroidota bacterium]